MVLLGIVVFPQLSLHIPFLKIKIKLSEAYFLFYAFLNTFKSLNPTENRKLKSA